MKEIRAHFPEVWVPGESLRNVRTIAYWTFTYLIAFEMVAGGIWDLLRIEYVRVVLAHLGYPMYLLTILGVWKIPCAIALLLPGLARIKEWAYAGAVFNYTGAAASHYLAGYAGQVGPLFLAAITLASWALRPPARRLAETVPATEKRMAPWMIPILSLIVLFVLSILFLPTGPPPGE